MKHKYAFLFIALFCCINAFSQKITVKNYYYSGPHPIHIPFIADSTNVQGQKFNDKELLNTPLSLNLATQKGEIKETSSDGELILSASASYALHLVSFYIQSNGYGKGTLTLKGPELKEVYINQQKQNSHSTIPLTLEPQQYEVVVKYLTTGNAVDTLQIVLTHDDFLTVEAGLFNKRNYTLSDVTDGKRVQSASISPDGKFVIVNYNEVFPGGRNTSYTHIIDRTNGMLILNSGNRPLQWMPRSSKAYYTRQGIHGKELILVDPVTKEETVSASNLPDGTFRFSPTEDFLLFSIQEEGPSERRDVQQVLVPDDRQPGWRNRSFIHRYDLKTGLLERLTYGYLSTSIQDISADGRFLLFSCYESVLTEQPFSRTSLYQMDLNSRQVDTILQSAKYVDRASFAPDGTQLLITGSGNSFEGIGLNTQSGQQANISDGQLFLYNPANQQATPLTKDFNPSIDYARWNPFDKQIYALAKDRDYVRLYTIDPVKRTIRQLPVQEEVLNNISLATNAPAMVYYGMSVSNPQRLYAMDLKKGASTCLIDPAQELMKDIQLGEVHDWNFVSASGDSIYGRYYLPPHFDPNKKYPMIVNYYGGTTPTARVLESRYPSHVYAGMGFIVYIVQPSGATGFGQEFSARHINAWGKYTADEIIEGTCKFCETHPFVDPKRIGCMGASYGGFMTMYLLTQTDLFAAGMSHAGISDITSYWGEGYWGYSYSELASANSYPWNAREMYTLQSPLFHADKINTPLLFLHGAADTNVPVGESIQMFTALKLLGKETAFVQVEGENHHILDYDKRIRWNQSIYAWFFKWLKDRPEWWEALYPAKKL
ncbi:prolyl oligopeptidase family serine peptidase [Parabacteroides sp. PF5-9]|uniref:S9 family peptidase n=1 Tax=Parabacteroides sp. PF5-9 TaxID=1742404 RepID=UPI0024749959|nr:prolyl oligopeptidase family serine peptidase [Parabacteroides sp. PF5-9]MDH6358787.1 dipeptidyl aminopeptidase/acylaminoacyl peptidase [Parabacteroides sp. PF5-9]